MFFLAACLSLIVFQLKGQEAVTRFFETYHNIEATRSITGRVYKNLEGSPYLNAEFEQGLAYMKDQKVYKLPMRFNIYENSIEFKMDSAILTIDKPNEVDKIELGGKVFIYYPLNKKHQFLESLVVGKLSLLCKSKVTIEKEKPAEAYKEMKPAHFRRRKDLYYIVKSDEQTHLVKNKKSLLNFLSDKKGELGTFIKKEKIKIKKKKDDYYNSL